MQQIIAPERASSDLKTTRTRTLLMLGVVAGPLYTFVGLIQAFTRPGFDLTRHALSLLETGDLGWLEIATFLLSGLLFVASAWGLRLALRGSRGGAWGPVLVGIVGVGLIGAGCFTADPGLGFPPGTPETAAMSWHGFGHLIFSSLSFLALLATCLAFTRRWSSQRQYGWAAYALISGLLSFVSFAGLATGHLWMTSAFVFTMLNAYVWVSVMEVKLLFERSRTSA